MSTIIQRQIRSHLKMNDLTASDLEKKAGVSGSSIRNIISGRSSNPTIETLIAISKVLGCSVNDLIMEQESHSTPKTSKLEIKHVDWVASLLLDIINFAELCFREKNYTPSFEDGIYLVKEIYQYSLGKQQREVDKKFAEWLINKKIQED